MGEMRNIYKLLIGNPERKRSFGRNRSILDDNIRTGLKEIVWEIVE
jgi:hypothetical protein